MIGETTTTGVAYLFKSKDLKHWELVDNHLYTLPGTGIWECIDFYCPDPSSQNNVLKASLFNTQHDVYALGSYDSATHKFIPNNLELDFSGFESSRYDYGRVYASDSLFEPVKQRHIVLS
jgi:beta-fructofuranosidase